MKLNDSVVKLSALPILCIALLGSVACSTTRVILPEPASVTVAAPTAAPAAPAAQPMAMPSMPRPATLGSIPSVAANTGQFNTLLIAVRAADLEATLAGPGPITLFAPTDAAFDKLAPATLQRLLKPENRAVLRQVLTYHVFSGRAPSSGLMGKTMTSPTVEGSSVFIDGRNGVMVNNARVIQADIEASNGLIHSIDTVLLPPDMMVLR
jgi:uncharacterized surface protein with fasciclin (FAS1) repeats